MDNLHPEKNRRAVALLVSVASLAVAWAALAGGFTPKGTQPPVTHPILEPSNCQGCHGDFDFASNHEPYPTWAGSMMANSARDPLFWAALDVAENDLPGIGDFCLRCHTPNAWLAGRSEPPGGSTDGCGLLGNIDEEDNDFSGVSCHLCHRMMENPSPPMGEDPVYFENAEYWIDDADCTSLGSGPCRRGPYDYTGPDSPPPHEWAFSTYHTGSDICGNCHNVTSPALNLIDDNGQDTGVPFPIERTFAEWQASDYAPGGATPQSCQDCHMPQTDADPAFACVQAQNDRTGDLAVHQFAGGNTWVPAVLRGEYPNLGRTESFDATIAWAVEMLESAATVEVTPLGEALPGSDFDVEVKVTNLTGHKLPTGYPEGRRMWLQVTARDAADAVFWESGAYDAATGVLTHDDQLKLYAAEPGIYDRNGTGDCDVTDGGGSPIFHFVLNDCYALDNRIPPLGFTGGSDPELRPWGYSYPETSPGSGVLVNYDTTGYQIPIPAGTAFPITVEATLLFQTTSKEYVEFLRDQAAVNNFPDDCIPRTTGLPGMSRGALLYTLWESYDRSPPVNMTAANTQAADPLPIFLDGFESGDTTAWSATVP